MPLQQLKAKHKPKKRKRVGRGGGHGTYSGRGQKGQKARSGPKLQPIIRILIKRYPKLRGYREGGPSSKLTITNIGILEKKFAKNSVITPKILVEKRIIRRISGKVPLVKILGQGNLTKALIVEGCKVSKSAKEKIEKMGGKIR